jgi:hypothetical protein
MDIIDDMDEGEAEDEHQHSDSFFTSVESLLAASDIQPPNEQAQALDVRAPEVLTTMANGLVDELTSLSFTHQLTGENYTVEPEELPAEDTQTFTVGGTSRYSSQRFYGIVIDTGASKYSTAGLD